MERSQSKYFHTAEKMDEALLALLEKHDFEFITVKAICEKANVNRSTFYLHYETLDDILQETAEYVMSRFQSYFTTALNIKDHIEDAEKDALLLVDEPHVVQYLTFVKENQKLLSTVLRRFKTLRIDGIYDDWFQSLFSPIMARFGVPDKERNYAMHYYLCGTVAIVEEWMKNDCADSTEFVSNLIIKMINAKWY